MATRHPPPRHNPERPHRQTRDAVQWDHLSGRVATGLALALLMARPLFPSEDADTGSGLVPVALWGLTALVWGVRQAMRRRLCCFAAWIDLGPLILLATVLISAARSDTLRPAINMASEWTGLILSYFVLRQLFRSPASQRLFISAMVAVAFALAAYGIYQAFWGLQALQAEYASDRMRILQWLEIAPDSPQEETFRNRLNSHEPFATFALANSLAGFLVAWLPFALAWWFFPLLDRTNAGAPAPSRPESQVKRGVMHVIIGATLVLSILVCLILTQSRTAYVGVCMQLVLLSCFFGRMLLTGVRHRVGTTRMSVAGLGVATIIASVIAVAWHRGKIDEMVFTQAAKSFTYRLQYWQATVQLIRERPWGGTGPGNFRSHYLRHKLPESSEEIVDPHNMVLELVATSGLLAGAALIGCIGAGLAMILLRRSVHRTSSGSEGAISLWVAGVAAFIVAAALSPMVPWTYVALFLVWSLAAAAMWWLVPLEIDSSVIAIALIGLAVHLLGAGGISMPGVSQTLWAVLAVGVNISEGSGKPYQIQDMKWTRAVLLAGFAAWASFLLLVLRPVTAGLSALSLGRALVAQRDLGGSEVQFRAAAAEDRLSVEPWLELSRIHYERWRTDRGRTAEEQFGQAVAALDQAHQLAPSQLEPVRRLAELYEMRAEQTGGFWAKAAEKYKRCVEMYPTNAGLHAHLARALWKSGQAETALETAARARQLDAQTPHPDHKLTDADRKILEPLQAPLAPVE